MDQESLKSELKVIYQWRILAIQFDMWEEYLALVEYEKFLTESDMGNVYH